MSKRDKEQRRQAIKDRRKQAESGERSTVLWPMFINKEVLAKSGINSLYRMKEKNKLMIIPPPGSYYDREIYIHYGVGDNDEQVLSLYRCKGERDPISQHIRKLLKTCEPDDKVMRDWYAKRRGLFFVVDVSSSDSRKKGVQLLICPGPRCP